MKKQERGLKHRVIESHYIHKRPWLTARCERLEMADGRIIPEYYVLEYPDWVNTIAITKDGRYIMTYQYRHALQVSEYELCSGVCEEGEDPIDAARRELEEETGYTGGKWSHLMTISANPSTQNNLVHCFVARDVELTSERHLDPTEELEVHLLTRDEVIELLKTNSILQATHIAPLWRFIAEEK